MTKLVIFLVLQIHPFWQSEALSWSYWLKSGYIGIPSDLKIFPALKIWSIVQPIKFFFDSVYVSIFLEYFASCKYSNATQEGRRGGGFKWKAEVRLNFKTSMNLALRFLKYSDGQYFKPHMDGTFARPDGKERSFITIQVFFLFIFNFGKSLFFNPSFI